MTQNNRIYQYHCDVCDRTIEKIVDLSRPNLYNCVITKDCVGTLSVKKQRFGTQVRSTIPVSGLQDWVKRGVVTTNSATTSQDTKTIISTFPDSNGLTLGSLRIVSDVQNQFTLKDTTGATRIVERRPLGSLLPISAKVHVTLYEISSSSLQYKRYLFSFLGSASVVNGKDHSPQQNQLSFDSTSNLRVYVNGKLLSNTLYNSSVDGTILFNPIIEASIITIEVFVYKSLSQYYSQTTPIKLTFQSFPSNNSLRQGGAFGDTLALSGYAPLFCLNTNSLNKSKIYAMTKLESTDEFGESFDILPSSAFLLIAKAPYKFEDKYLNNIVSLSTIITNQYPIGFIIDPATGNNSLQVSSEAVSSLTRSMVVRKIDIKNTSISNIVGEVQTIKSFIIGPT